MTDRDLLELAAKAAGFHDATWATEQNCISTAKLPGFRCFWNPLTDDGDALRLAVKLKFKIIRWHSDGNVAIYKNQHAVAPICYERCGDDPYAATRRAIVRAAAEIGKGMK
jgi:hypothetical protein